jgi:hypothetical protein
LSIPLVAGAGQHKVNSLQGCRELRMKAAASKRNGNRNALTHGLHTLKRTISLLGGRTIDRRYRVGKALAQWRDDIVADLGGADTISTQQQALVELAVRSKLLLDSVDAWLLVQPSLINARKRTLLPVVIQRQALADALARYLAQLGLKRVSKEVSLQDYVQEKYGDQNK